MKGFFDISEIRTVDPKQKTVSCASCGLYQYVLSPRMKPFGNFKKRILNIGEAPGETEDQKGRQWQGKVGRRLQREYKRLGIDLFEDCLNINSINCRPTDSKGANRPPSYQEVACCRKRVLDVIEQYNPQVIVLLGNHAVESIIGHRWKKDLGGITKWRGWQIPDRDLGAWICPVFHPSYVEREDKPEVDLIWQKDLEAAISMTRIKFPEWQDEKQFVEIIDWSELSPIPDGSIVAIDYETTGLKPHASGQRIVCAGIARSAIHAQVFMMPDRPRERQGWIKMLANPQVKKMAHNMKFEQAWSVNRLRQGVYGWFWDSMLAAHIIDNRPGITNLKFQTYINFGVVDYASEITPFLQSNSKNGNAMNKLLDKISDPDFRNDLMKYCGLDAIYEYKLAMKQMEALNG